MVGQNDWKFPELNAPTTDLQSLFTSGLDAIENLDLKTAANVADQVGDPQQNGLQQEETEISQLKQAYSERIQLSNQVLQHLANQVKIIDEDIMQLINDVIHKITVKIIHQELKQDPQVLMNMIRSTLDEIPEQKAPITIFISPVDKEKITEMTEDNLIWQTDANLASGDFIIKSQIAELRAILPQRIERLLGISHE